ncbi:MAG: TetR/AcrR family transcriptional regulator, partial [Gemmatimonadota bacterium]
MDDRPSYDEKLLAILQGAAAVFADKGYHQASIRDISAATGVSLSGLYYYFSSKEELLFLIQDHCFSTLLEQLQDDLAREDDPELRLRLLVRNHLRFFVDNMKEMKVLSHESDVLTARYRDRILQHKRDYVRTVQELLEELRPDGGANLRT